MGSVFSGRPGPRGGKTAVESLPRVQVNGMRGRSAAAAGSGPRVVFAATDLAEVTYGTWTWHVHLAETTPHLGGRRRWLLCPTCSCRRTALYIGGTVLACRICLGLRYASQHETERDRLFRRANKLRDRLGWGGGVADGAGPRPRGGMRRRFDVFPASWRFLPRKF
jgi:hypothetical protein